MTENAFWAFLNMTIAIKGRVEQVSGCIDSDNRDICENGRYIGGHSVLFNGYDNLSEDRIEEVGSLLFDQTVSKEVKEAVLMLLAHYSNKKSDYELKRESNLTFKGEVCKV